MPRVSPRIRVRLLILAGLVLAAYPLVTGLEAHQAPGGAQGAPAMIHTEDLDPRLRGFRWREIGPTGQGGRIDDFAVDENDPSTYYIGFAVSGLWKTTNNGTTYRPVMDTLAHSIGDVALAPSNPQIVYVGTGEPNNRQSSSFGEGVFKSTNGGDTWEFIGLKDTQSIGRIIVHPKNPDIVWVAAVGHLFGPNDERGVFMTTDGGKTWNKTLYMNQDTGATDIVINPSNPNHLLAATYERRRTAWGFVGGGLGSALHESTDGGKTWRKVTGNGLPRGTMGRIGLDWSRSNPNIVYAQIEVAPDKEPPAPPPPPGQEPAGRGGRGGGGGFGGRGGGPQPPNPQSSGVWRSADRGRTWTFMSNENQRPMYYSQIRVDPNTENTIYVGGVTPRKSIDGGKTWISLQGQGHVDNHAIWINPEDSNHVMYGNDGGLDVSYDGGETWESVRMWSVALPYHVSVDNRRPYWVCTGLQDNGSWCGPSHVRSNDGIRQWHWISVGGGDGFQTQVDPTDPFVFYTESQNGGINRYDLNTGTSRSARPQPPQQGGGGGGRAGGGRGGRGGGRGNVVGDVPNDGPSAFNWNTPIRISPHNPHTLLIGGRQLFISRNRGETFTMSRSLGRNIDPNTRTLLEQPYNRPSCGGGNPGVPCILSRNDGLVGNEFGTILEIAESPVVPGTIWIGTNDGNVQVTRDNGHTWTDVTKNMPEVGGREYWVSGVEASYFDLGTAYVSLDGHHSDDLEPYVFKTTDFGRTWTNISGNLPIGNVNSIRQDPVNRNLLYAAAEFGFYISLDDGGSWHTFMPNLPKGRIDEIVVHPRENDLVLAHHGRGIWIMDDITALQRMTPDALKAPATLFEPRDAVLWRNDFRLSTEIPGEKWWRGEIAPRGTAIAYYLGAPAREAKVTITSLTTGNAVRTCAGPTAQGLNRFQWTLAGDPPPVTPEQIQQLEQLVASGGGRGGVAAAQAQLDAARARAKGGLPPCTGGDAGRGGRRGGGGGGGGGGIGPGAYRVTLSVDGQDVGSHTFSLLEDVWMHEK